MKPKNERMFLLYWLDCCRAVARLDLGTTTRKKGCNWFDHPVWGYGDLCLLGGGEALD